MAWDAGVSWYLDRVTPPTGDVVTVQYLKEQHLRLTTGTIEDERLARAIAASTDQAERYMGRALLSQQWNLIMDRFPSCVEIPLPPLISIDTIDYLDENGATQTLPASDYIVLHQRGPNARRSQVVRNYDVSWPSTRFQANAVTLRFTAGYGVDTDVPDSIKEGIGLRAAEFYKQRSDSVIGPGIAALPAVVASERTWQPFRVYG